MSLLISSPAALRYARLREREDYEPISQGSRQVMTEWQNYLRGSASDWLPTLHSTLKAIREECSRKNWDSEQGLPVTDKTIATAEKIVTALFFMVQPGTPAPDITPESDGEILLDWTLAADLVFSISVGERGKINFAGQFAEEGGRHGWKPIDTSTAGALEASLREIVGYIEKLYPPTADQRAA